MKEIQCYLKEHIISTVVAMLLFVIQGLCLIGLIVCINSTIDTGLLKYGYESISPEALLKSSFESRVIDLPEEDKAFVEAYYTLLDKNSMTVEEYQVYEKSYPVIASELIYKKNWIGQEEISKKLDEVFAVSTEEMLYEYMNLGMKPMDNQKAYIKREILRMSMAAIIFALAFAGANMLVASISSKVGYDERSKIVQGEGKGLRQSLDLQDKIKTSALRFYAWVLAICAVISAFYCFNSYNHQDVSQGRLVILVISLLVFSVAIYSAISLRGKLNKGIFLVIKVMVLGGVTALFGKNVALVVIFGYVLMLSLLSIIRIIVGKKLNTLIADHEDNIDNIDGQMTFVMNKDDVEIEAAQMKKMVRSYLTNNDYLYRSSWMLEFLENLDKAMVALFNFFGVILVIAGFSFMYISMGASLIMILPLIMIYNF